jgi:hypothetical protein
VVHGAHPGLIRPSNRSNGHRFYNFTQEVRAHPRATFLLAPFLLVITLPMRRSNPRLAPLAYIQLVCVRSRCC